MKTFLAAAVTTVALATGASAASVDINFEDLVANIGEQGVEGQTFDFGGLSVTLTSNGNDAYLDGVSGGLPAGLGVCSTGLDTNGECNVPGDDNVTMDEAVTITFSQAVLSVSNFVFRAASHEDISDSTEFLIIGGVDDLSPTLGDFSGPSTFADAANYISSQQVGNLYALTFSFADTEFYLSSFTAEIAAVPLPASILLMGGALGGLGALRRRKKA